MGIVQIAGLALLCVALILCLRELRATLALPARLAAALLLFGAALALYAYEADIVGLVISANEPFCVFPPNCVHHVNRDVIGIISGIDKPDANVPLAERWLKNCGLKPEKLFYVSSYTREGLDTIIDYLNQE